MECAGLETQLIVIFFHVPRETGWLLLPKKHVHLGKIESKGVLTAI